MLVYIDFQKKPLIVFHTTDCLTPCEDSGAEEKL